MTEYSVGGRGQPIVEGEVEAVGGPFIRLDDRPFCDLAGFEQQRDQPDDPANDPIGTRRLSRFGTMIKVREHVWVSVGGSDGDFLIQWDNLQLSQLVTAVIGAVE